MTERLTLSQYIALIGETAAASLFGVSVSAARAYKDGRRVPAPKRAAYIVKVTGKRLRWEDIYAARIDSDEEDPDEDENGN